MRREQTKTLMRPPACVSVCDPVEALLPPYPPNVNRQDDHFVEKQRRRERKQSGENVKRKVGAAGNSCGENVVAAIKGHIVHFFLTGGEREREREKGEGRVKAI